MLFPQCQVRDLEDKESPQVEKNQAGGSPGVGVRVQGGTLSVVVTQAERSLWKGRCEPQEAGGEVTGEGGVTRSRAPQPRIKSTG